MDMRVTTQLPSGWILKRNRAGWVDWHKRTMLSLGLRLPKKRPDFWLRKMTPAQHEEIQGPGEYWPVPDNPVILSVEELGRMTEETFKAWNSGLPPKALHTLRRGDPGTEIGGWADRAWFAEQRRRIHGS